MHIFMITTDSWWWKHIFLMQIKKSKQRNSKEEKNKDQLLSEETKHYQSILDISFVYGASKETTKLGTKYQKSI